jgi:lysyl-tRNA synthetase, class II
MLCFVIGLVDIVIAISPRLRDTLRLLTGWLPGAYTDAALAFTLSTGVLLVLLAHGLSRRKRRAWRAVVFLLSLSVLLHIVQGPDLFSAAIAAALLVALIAYRSEFFALGDPTTRWRALWVFCAMAVADFVIGYLLVTLRVHDAVGEVTRWDKVQQVVLGLIGIPGPITFNKDQDFLYIALLLLGLTTLVVTAYLVFRPAEPLPEMSAQDETNMRELIARFGERDSLGYFALRGDKSVMWSASGKACIAYRVVSGVMLASGDPLGDIEAWPGAIEAFCEEALRHAWVPAVMGCSAQGAEVWCREAELEALEIGDEAIVEVEDFSLDGRNMRNVRQMLHRIERAGYSTQVRRVTDIDSAQRELLRSQADAWRDTETERGFSMALGRFGDPRDPDCVVVTGTADGVLKGALHFVPWGGEGWSLDLMRRDRDAQPGLNEMLIVAALRAAPDFGIRRLSLNFAVFRSALERGERIGAGPITRMWRDILVFMSRWFQIESLYRFNAKFQPAWEPRFVVYPDTHDLPRIVVAALEAESFLVGPSWWRRGRRLSTLDPLVRA